MTVENFLRPERHNRADANVTPQLPIDEASWIWRAGAATIENAETSDTRPTPESLAAAKQVFLRFRREFDASPDAAELELDVSADERFVLLLDGVEVGRGPHRGLPNHWHSHSYRVRDLEPGRHLLEAVCWQISAHAPLAQLSVRGGFILKASGTYDVALTTGKAKWQVAVIPGTRMTDKGNSKTFGVGSECEVRGASVLDAQPPPEAWEDAVTVRGPVETWAGLRMQGWIMFPTPIPDMMRERKTPGRFVGCTGNTPPSVVPPHSSVEILWDLEDYYCAYPELRVSGGRGASVRWDWAECLVGADGHKHDRAACEGLHMENCFGDTFLPDGRGGARFTTPWWRCGRWCRIKIATADEPLSIESIAIVETRLPVSLLGKFESDDKFVATLQGPCERALQMCMHEMFFDCPYYEQQMYPGDSRVQYLVATLFGDVGRAAVRNAIALYDADRRENGMMPMNCPTRGTQESFPFTCCQAMMLGDFAWNHNDRKYVRARLPGLVHTLMGMEEFVNDDGLLVRTPGWNFIDWVRSWESGVPPDGNSDRPNAEINLEYLHALLSGVRASEALGEKQLAAHFGERADRLRAAIRAAFWCPEKALFSSDVAHSAFSQHAQALALLGGVPLQSDADRCFAAFVANSPAVADADVSGPKEDASAARSTARPNPTLKRGPELFPGSIYFRHYLFSTYFAFRRPDLFFSGLDFWHESIEDWHCATIPEIPDTDSRSDCHGWGSHPLWHLHTGVAGVRSAAPFYASVLIDPQPAHLRRIVSSTPTPHGPVALDLRFEGNAVAGVVTLPDGLPGTFRWRGQDIPVAPGRNEIDLGA